MPVRYHIERSERNREIVAMRRAGARYEQIAEHLNISEGTAHKVVREYMDDVKATTTDEAHTIRDMMIERLDQMLAGVWEKASGGDTRAIQAALSIETQRARLLGLYEPRRADVTLHIKELAQKYGLDEAEAVEIAERVIRGGVG